MKHALLPRIMGNLLWLYGVPVPAGAAGLLCTGLFCGIFTGCLTGAIAEILDAFPVFFRRINLKTGTAFVIAAMAVGVFLACWRAILDRYWRNSFCIFIGTLIYSP